MILAKKRKVKNDQTITQVDTNSVKPFIRWAGGKQNLVKNLSENLPKQPFNKYFEPFVGAGVSKKKLILALPYQVGLSVSN